jgi:GTPase SAR1 family protein
VIFLVGNKLDKVIEDEVSREVPYEEALDYAMTQGLGFMEVSAHQDLHLTNLFEIITRQLLVTYVKPPEQLFGIP